MSEEMNYTLPSTYRGLHGFSRFVIATRDMKKLGMINSEVTVMFCLAAHVKDDAGLVDPSQSQISAECGLSTVSVRRAIFRLEEKGLLIVERDPSPHTTHIANKYYLNIKLIESRITK